MMTLGITGLTKRLKILKKRYVLKDGAIYWHRLYYDSLPEFFTNNSLPFIHGYNLGYYMIRPHKIIRDYYLEIKWWWQRATQGYSDCDVWNWCDRMTKLNIAVLKRLRANHMGHPAGMSSKKWDSIMDQMIDGFQAREEEENDFTSYKKLSQEELTALRESRRKRTQTGLRLFAKYFYHLWD